jgi:putative ABC transport system permease protein
MIKNNFKTAFRYLWNHKVFSGINLIGLATGLCVSFFALLYVHFELSYDNYNKNADRIYRLVTDVETSAGTNYESTSAPMAPAIKAAFPEVQAATRVFLDYLIVQKDQDNFGEEAIAYADSSLFSVFTLPLVRGTASTVFNTPFNIVLSETAARKYFGKGDPIGKTLLIDGKNPATVTGIMKDMPNNSHFRVDIFLSMSTLLKEFAPGMNTNWKKFGFYTYLLLPKNYNPSKLAAKLPDFIKNSMDESQVHYSLALEPLKDVYLKGKSRGNRTGSSISGNINNVYIFSLIAIFVLFIACFNFINLTTAFSLQRAKEIGVRKVLGASKKQLIFQFLFDAVLLCVIAFAIALILCVLLLPVINQLSGKIISTTIFEPIRYIGLLFLIAISIGLVAGIYPAFFLSRFQPISSLKGKFISGTKGLLLRKVLIVTQFSISIILIIATIVVYTQLHYMQNHDLGFKKDHQLVIDFHFDDRIVDHSEVVKQQLMSLPGISMASMSSAIPGRFNHTFPTEIEGPKNNMEEFRSDSYFVDDDFLSQYQIQLIAGRAFSKDIGSDTKNAMIINEAALKSLGYHDPNSVIGKRFTQRGNSGTIIGVIKDFHFHSFTEEVRPLTFIVAPGFFTFLTLDISSKNLQGTMKSLENKWKELAPGMPMIYFFADDAYNAQYKSETQFGKLFMCLAIIAILLSCLGLLGLSAFSTVQRTKEIGIRKVLGSSVSAIVRLLTKDFLKLILISFVIGVPIAWLGMNKWLQEFAYRINISWWIFALAGIFVIFIAFLTISFQAIKAAVANPVESLRSE